MEIRHPDGRPFADAWETIRDIEQKRARAKLEAERAERLAAQLRALGIEPNS